MAISASKLEVEFGTKGTQGVIADIDRVGDKVESTANKSKGFWKGALAAGTGFLGANVIAGLGRNIVGLGQSFIMANADAEAFRNQLNVAVGDVDKAGVIFAEMQKFAKDTPFEFPELIQGAANLEALGQSSQKWMPIIGDTAAATNKSIDQTVQAVLDAQTGEFERLKEFGIRTKVEGDKVKFSFMQNGQEMVVEAENTSEGISSALMSIWDQKYDGAMDTMSQTFLGQLSTLKDNVSMTLQGWTKPLFEFAKTGIKAANDFFTRFDSLNKYASTSDAIIKALSATIKVHFGSTAGRVFDTVVGKMRSMWRVGEDIAGVFLDVARATGSILSPALSLLGRNMDLVMAGAKGIAIAIGAFMAWGAITSIVAGLGVAIGALASPILLIAGLAATMGIAWDQNWGDIQGKTAEVIGWLTGTAWPAIQNFVGNIIDAFSADGLSGVIASLLDQVRSIDIGQVIVNIGSWARGQIADLWDAVSSWASSALDGITGAAATVWNVIVNIGSWAKGIVTDIWPYVTAWASDALSFVSGAAGTLWGVIVNVGSWAKGIVSDIWPYVKSWASAAWDTVKETAHTIWGVIVDIGSWTKGTILAPIGDAIDGAVTSAYADYVAAGVAPQLSGVPVEISDFDVSVQDGALSNAMPTEAPPSELDAAYDKGFQYGYVPVQKFIDGINWGMDQAIGLFSAGGGGGSGAGGGGTSRFDGLVANILGGFDGAMTAISNGMRDIPTKFAQDVAGPALNNMFGSNSPLVSGLRKVGSGMRVAFNQVKDDISDAWDTLSDIDLKMPTFNWPDMPDVGTLPFVTDFVALLGDIGGIFDSVSWSFDISMPDITWPSDDDLLALVPEGLKKFVTDPIGWLTDKLGGGGDEGKPTYAPNLPGGYAPSRFAPEGNQKLNLPDFSGLDAAKAKFAELKAAYDINIPPISAGFASAPAAWAAGPTAGLAGIKAAFDATLPPLPPMTQAAFGAAQAAATSASAGMQAAVSSNANTMKSNVSLAMAGTQAAVAMQSAAMAAVVKVQGLVMVQSATSSANSLRSVLTSGAAAAAAGVSAGLGRIPGIVASVGGQAVSIARSVGVNIGDAFARGMESQLGRIQAAANAMVAAASAALIAKAMISSPSKLFWGYGEYVPAGFAGGIREATPMVASAISDMLGVGSMSPIAVGAGYGPGGPQSAFGGYGSAPAPAPVQHVTNIWLTIPSDDWLDFVRKAEAGEAAPARVAALMAKAQSLTTS